MARKRQPSAPSAEAMLRWCERNYPEIAFGPHGECWSVWADDIFEEGRTLRAAMKAERGKHGS